MILCTFLFHFYFSADYLIRFILFLFIYLFIYFCFYAEMSRIVQDYAFFILTLLAQLYARISILLTCGKHFVFWQH